MSILENAEQIPSTMQENLQALNIFGSSTNYVTTKVSIGTGTMSFFPMRTYGPQNITMSGLACTKKIAVPGFARRPSVR